uniref:LAGLIDADG endonuclease n=1 Tax=Peronospora matthiolae TaxID=2874970 RepID=A0AAV1UV27_9STRA
MRVALDGDGGCVLYQEEAISDLLLEHGFMDAKSTFTQIGADCYQMQSIDSVQLKATSTNGAPINREFQSLVGSLLWVARCTIFDIAFAVHKTKRQTREPWLHDWKPAKRVDHYLEGTKTMKINMKPRNVGCASIKIFHLTTPTLPQIKATGSR